MGSFISRVVRRFVAPSRPAPPPEVKPRSAVAAKVQPKAAVGAAAGPGETAKASTVRRSRGPPTQTIMTAAAGDTSDAPVQYKKLLGA